MQILPSQPNQPEPASSAGFSFLLTYGVQKRYQNVKHLNYYPARLSRGKKWYFVYRYRNPKTGEWKSFKVYENINRIKDKAEKEETAREIIEAINRALKEGFNPFAIEYEQFKEEQPKVWTLGQGLNYFKQKLSDRGLRKRSIQSYQSVLRMLNKNLAPVLHKDITAINKTHIQAALSNNGWGNTTYNNNITFVKAIFSYLIDADIVKENPAKGIKPLPESIKRNRPFGDTLWKNIKEKASPDLLEFLIFLYNTGTRPNEARQLRYEQIVKDQLLIPGAIAKNRKDRFIPLSKAMIHKYKGNGLIFGTSVNYFSQKFRDEVKKPLKLGEEYNLYSIKGTKAIHLYEDGISLHSIMTFFGHHSLEVTQRYLRGLGLTINREAADKARDI